MAEVVVVGGRGRHGHVAPRRHPLIGLVHAAARPGCGVQPVLGLPLPGQRGVVGQGQGHVGRGDLRGVVAHNRPGHAHVLRARPAGDRRVGHNARQDRPARIGMRSCRRDGSAVGRRYDKMLKLGHNQRIRDCPDGGGVDHAIELILHVGTNLFHPGFSRRSDQRVGKLDRIIGQRTREHDSCVVRLRIAITGSRFHCPARRQRRRPRQVQGQQLPVRGVREVAGDGIRSRRIVPVGPMPGHGVGFEQCFDRVVVRYVAERMEVVGIALPERLHVGPIHLDRPDIVTGIRGHGKVGAPAVLNGHAARRRDRTVRTGGCIDRVSRLDADILVIVQVLPGRDAQVGIISRSIAKRCAAESQALYREIR